MLRGRLGVSGLRVLGVWRVVVGVMGLWLVMSVRVLSGVSRWIRLVSGGRVSMLWYIHIHQVGDWVLVAWFEALRAYCVHQFAFLVETLTFSEG